MTAKQPLCAICLEKMFAAGMPVVREVTWGTNKCSNCNRRRYICGYIVVESAAEAPPAVKSEQMRMWRI